MTKTIIPYGYAPDIAKGYKRLDELMSVPMTVLIDIRLVAHCEAFPAWNGEALARHYGHDEQGKARYIHLRALGNTNYRKEDRHKGFSLKAQRIGLDKLIAGLNAGYTIILLCGCRDYAYCHRSLVVQLLAAEVSDLIVENKPKMTPLILIDEPLDSVEQTEMFAQPYKHFDS